MKERNISIADEILKLNELKEKGILSEIEFLKQKKKLLNYSSTNKHLEITDDKIKHKNKEYPIPSNFYKVLKRSLIIFLILLFIGLIIIISGGSWDSDLFGNWIIVSLLISLGSILITYLHRFIEGKDSYI